MVNISILYSHLTVILIKPTTDQLHRRYLEVLLRHASQAHGRGQPLNNRGLVGQLAFSAVVLFSLQSARAQSPPQTVRRVAGVTKQITVPMVSEPWTATVSLPPRPLQKQARFIGHYPGFREAKQRANQATLRRLARKHFSMMGKAFALSLLAATTSTIVFDGPSESDTHVFPPDPQVASGPTQVVVAVNTLLAVYDKTGLLEGSFQQLSSFFSGLGVTGQISDPRLIYDQVNNRFILSAADVISQTSRLVTCCSQFLRPRTQQEFGTSTPSTSKAATRRIRRIRFPISQGWD